MICVKNISLVGTINVLLTNPLWVVNTRIKMQGTKKNKAVDEWQDPDEKFNGLFGKSVTELFVQNVPV